MKSESCLISQVCHFSMFQCLTKIYFCTNIDNPTTTVTQVRFSLAPSSPVPESNPVPIATNNRADAVLERMRPKSNVETSVTSAPTLLAVSEILFTTLAMWGPINVCPNRSSSPAIAIRTAVIWNIKYSYTGFGILKKIVFQMCLCFVFFSWFCNLFLNAPFLHQQNKFYREVSLQDSYYSFVIIYMYARNWPVLNIYIKKTFSHKKD